MPYRGDKPDRYQKTCQVNLSFNYNDLLGFVYLAGLILGRRPDARRDLALARRLG
jgi:hypothetical protein